MDERERQALYAFAVSRPASWYVDHPNADQAAARIFERLRDAPLLTERQINALDSTPHPHEVEHGEPHEQVARCPLNTVDLQVLGGLAGGLTEVALADELGVSVHSIRRRVARICGRLGVTGHRSAAVAQAIRQGWL